MPRRCGDGVEGAEPRYDRWGGHICESEQRDVCPYALQNGWTNVSVFSARQAARMGADM
jgi:hypothetical protein